MNFSRALGELFKIFFLKNFSKIHLGILWKFHPIFYWEFRVPLANTCSDPLHNYSCNSSNKFINIFNRFFLRLFFLRPFFSQKIIGKSLRDSIEILIERSNLTKASNVFSIPFSRNSFRVLPKIPPGFSPTFLFFFLISTTIFFFRDSLGNCRDFFRNSPSPFFMGWNLNICKRIFLQNSSIRNFCRYLIPKSV